MADTLAPPDEMPIAELLASLANLTINYEVARESLEAAQNILDIRASNLASAEVRWREYAAAARQRLGAELDN